MNTVQILQTKKECEDYLLSLSNIPRAEYMRDPKACAKYLERLQFFLDILDNPEKDIPRYIHVTGTSGKGSVCSFIEQILLQTTDSVGMLTSPHHSDITERWRVGGNNMSNLEFINISKQISAALEIYTKTAPYDMLSFFEITTAIALLYFKEKKVTYAIMEVGCGGRFDGTNVIPHKDIAVITNIDLDHTHILGDTKEKIAYEKAGIITAHTKHVISGITETSLQKIIQNECTFHSVSPLFITPKDVTHLSEQIFTYKKSIYRLNVHGAHQPYNAALAIETAKNLQIPDRAIQKGLQVTRQPLRFECISSSPYIIIDGAHNMAKIKSTVATYQKWITEKNLNRKLHILAGFSEQTQEKNMKTMLTDLATLSPT